MHNQDKAQINQKEPVVNLTLSGGGAKGIMYTGAYEALHETGLLKQIEEVAGSSIGALIVTLMATGVDPKLLTALLRTKAFTEFTRPTRANNLFMMAIQAFVKYNGIPANEDNLPLQQFIEKLMRFSIKEHLETDGFKQKFYVYTTNTEVNAEEVLEKLKNKLTTENTITLEEPNNFKTTAQKITFADLALLREIDPEKFKKLHITATATDSKNKGKLLIFNAENSPDTAISLAAGASSAFPGAFKLVKINNVNYCDGGIVDNIPISYFSNKGRTLTFCFAGDDTKAYYNVLHSNSTSILSKWTSSISQAYLNSFVGGIIILAEKNIETAKYLRKEHAINTIILDPKDIGMLDINKATEKFSQLHDDGKKTTLEHLAKYVNVDQKPQEHNELSKVKTDGNDHKTLMSIPIVA